MTDLNAKAGDRPDALNKPERAVGRPTVSDRREVRFVELLFFAYRDFISDPDAVLLAYGFGRAHHRVIHFVNRHPGIRVADLLDILKITKQSLGRVLKQMVDLGFIEQRQGAQDRRQRLLYATDAGRGLAARLMDPQLERIGRALAALGAAEQAGAEEFLRLIIDASEREKVARLVRR